MDGTQQQKADYEMITALWHILKEYGDITNEDRDLNRWSQIIDLSDEIVERHPEARGMVKELRFILNDRAKSKN